jgi:hypothetical protein
MFSPHDQIFNDFEHDFVKPSADTKEPTTPYHDDPLSIHTRSTDGLLEAAGTTSHAKILDMLEKEMDELEDEESGPVYACKKWSNRWHYGFCECNDTVPPLRRDCV